MDPSNRYAINAPDVVAESFDGQTVILNLSNGHYFSLRGIATPIWSLLLAGYTPTSILVSIQANRPELLEASRGFLERLIVLNLVHPRDTGHGDLLGPIDSTWSGEDPHIEIFDDLAELIYADPIHDVDERAGWPTPRPTPS